MKMELSIVGEKISWQSEIRQRRKNGSHVLPTHTRTVLSLLVVTSPKSSRFLYWTLHRVHKVPFWESLLQAFSIYKEFFPLSFPFFYKCGVSNDVRINNSLHVWFRGRYMLYVNGYELKQKDNFFLNVPLRFSCTDVIIITSWVVVSFFYIRIYISKNLVYMYFYLFYIGKKIAFIIRLFTTMDFKFLTMVR